MKEKKVLSNAQRNLYGIADFGFMFLPMFANSYWAFFLTDIAKFDIATYRTISVVATTVYAIWGPFSGIPIEKVKPMKWGKIRSWLIIGPPIVFILHIFKFVRIGSSDLMAAIIVTLGYIFCMCFWNIPYNASVALIPVVSENQEDRSVLASRRSMWCTIGSVGFSLLIPNLIVWMSSFTSNSVTYLVAGQVCALLWIIFALVQAKLFKGFEPDPKLVAEQEAANPEKTKSEKLTASDMLKIALTDKHLYALWLADLARMVVYTLVNTVATYYFTYVSENIALLSVALTVGNITSFVGAYLSGVVSSKIQTKNTTGLFCLILTASLVLCRVFAFKTMVFIVFFALINLALGALQALVIALYSDVAVYSEYHYKKKAHSFVVGLSNLPIGISTISNSIILAAVLKSSGYIAGAVPTMEVKLGLSNIFLYLAPLALVGALAIFFIYGLTAKKMNEMQQALDQGLTEQ